MQCLGFVGGWAHPAASTGPAIADALGSLGHDVVVVDTFEAAADRLRRGDVDMLVVHACRFRMLDARYTPEQRQVHASRTPTMFRQAVVAHVGAQRPLLAMHTASLCFDDWPAWTQIIGASWTWERSNHPPLGRFQVSITGHPVVAGLSPFTVTDELYRFVEPADDAGVVATATDDEGIVHPAAWLHQSGAARVAYTALGHDERSLTEPGHRALLGRMVDWLVSR